MQWEPNTPYYRLLKPYLQTKIEDKALHAKFTRNSKSCDEQKDGIISKNKGILVQLVFNWISCQRVLYMSCWSPYLVFILPYKDAKTLSVQEILGSFISQPRKMLIFVSTQAKLVSLLKLLEALFNFPWKITGKILKRKKLTINDWLSLQTSYV